MMQLEYYGSLKDTDLMGRFFFKVNTPGILAYYEAMRALDETIFHRREWYEHVTGYYINQMCGPTNGEITEPTIRVSYFIPENKIEKLEIKKLIDWSFTTGKYLKDYNIELVEEVSEKPREEIIHPMYGGESLNMEFRCFLCIYTSIFMNAISSKGFDIHEMMNNTLKMRIHQDKSAVKYLKRCVGHEMTLWRTNPSMDRFLYLFDFSDWRHFWMLIAYGTDMDPLERAVYNKQSKREKRRMIDKMRVKIT